MRYYVNRLTQAVVVLLLAITVTFVLYRLMPLNPIEMIRAQMLEEMAQGGQTLTPEDLERVDRRIESYTGFDPDQSVYAAYFEYMTNILIYQDFGQSIRLRQPVFDLMLDRLPWSVFISVYGLALGVTTSLLFGAIMAYYEGGRFDKAMTVITISMNSVPYYVVAIMTLIVFAFGLGWFPITGRSASGTTAGVNLPYIKGIIHHATLPVLSGFVAGFGGALAYRGNCVREMGKGYLRVARLRGISESRLAIRYVGRNALLPIYTGLMMGIAGIFGSSVILEIIFNYQAMGLLTFDALLNRDYPLLMGSFIFYTAITLVGLLIADLTYGIIDPRVKGGAERETY